MSELTGNLSIFALLLWRNCGGRVIFGRFIRFEWRALRKSTFDLVFLLAVDHPNNDNSPKSRFINQRSMQTTKNTTQNQGKSFYSQDIRVFKV